MTSMVSRYDYMRESKVEDTDGLCFPDPLTIDYTSITSNLETLPTTISYNWPDLKKLWVAYYKKTGKLDMDDVMYSANGVEHVGVLEPEDTLYDFKTKNLKQYQFVNLESSDSEE